MGRRCHPSHDGGAALVEFTLLAVVLMVPLVYLLIVAASVQRAAFAVTGAVRDAGRAYVTAGSDVLGRARSAVAARVALQDAAVGWRGIAISCVPAPCRYAPGSTVTVTVVVAVPLPGLAAVFCGGTCRAAVPVRASHTERIDCFAPSPGAPPPVVGRC